MNIEHLNENVITQIRSSCNITSVSQCVTELIQNSLDSKCSAIAIRVNLSTFRIQVVDNGNGVTKTNLELLGFQYLTSKCHNLSDLRKYLKYYGYRGEALASIVKLSKSLNVTTRAKNSQETYSKTIENGGRTSKIEELRKQRPSCGSTVTVEGFLSGLPVRQGCVKTNELSSVKKILESFVIIHPKVAFSLRDDLSGNILINCQRQPNIIGSFTSVHPEIANENFGYVKVTKSRVTVEGLFHKELHENKKLQYLYVNKRPIVCSKITNLIQSLFKKTVASGNKNKHPVFVIQIKCPYSEIDLQLEPTKTCVLFKKIDVVIRCVKKLICNFLGEKNASPSKNREKKDETKSNFGVSQIMGAVKVCGVKRKLVGGANDWSPPKSPKIVIDEISPEPEKSRKKLAKLQPKMALPIEIRKSNNKERIPEKSLAETTLFTNFPENEYTGKEIIMDMFIKSTQIYRGNESSTNGDAVYRGNEDSSNGDVVELAEEIGNKTSSSFGVVKKVEMVSVGVQTGSSHSFSNNVNSGSATSTVPRKSIQKYISDYNCDFSQIEDAPGTSFNLADNPFLGLDKVPLFTCDETRKVFNFHQQEFSNVFTSERDMRAKNFDVTCLQTAKLSPIPVGKKLNFGRLGVVQSPYFRKEMLFSTRGRQLNSINEPFNTFNADRKEDSFTFTTNRRNFLAPKIEETCKFNPSNSQQKREKRNKNPKSAFVVTPYRTKRATKGQNETISKFFTSYQEKDETLEESNTIYQEAKESFTNFLKPRDLERVQVFSKIAPCQRNISKDVSNDTISKFFTPSKQDASEISKEFFNISKFSISPANNKTIFEINKNFGNFHKPRDLENAKIFGKPETSENFSIELPSKFFTPKEKESSISIEESVEQLINDESEDLFVTLNSKSSDDDQTHIVVTLNEEGKKQIIARDLSFELAINKNSVTQSQTKTSGWVKEVNSFGTTIYVNLTTGVRSLASPKNDNTFGLVKRIDFVPKGLSPILKKIRKVDPLTPEAKKIFDQALVGSLEDELLLVKWQNYIGQTDARPFFDEIYKEKSKSIEGTVPNVNKTGLARNLVKTLNSRSFTKQLFENLVTVGQVDCKFIASFDKSTKLLLLFDQHAVHERVRLELLLEGYRNSSAKIENSITIFLPKTHLGLIKGQKSYLKSLGLVFDYFTDGIIVFQVPLCIYNKSKKGVNLTELTQNLVKEIVETLMSDGVLVKTPQIIQNLINMEACRGAIKFGDKLENDECTLHLRSLSECTLPFQCAHGRPTLTPLILLDKTWDLKVTKPNLGQLK